MSQSFDQYERSLWRVLSQLARSGYAVPPSEARDLIHDFFLEAWQGLMDRYQPNRGSFSTYLFAAFYRFARRRIIRLQHWRSRLTDIRELALYVDESVDVEQSVNLRRQIQDVNRLISQLPKHEQDVLRDFLSDEEMTERRLALKYAVSRYRLREVLANALGKVMLELTGDLTDSTIERRIMIALWREGRTARDTAIVLGISIAEVQSTRKRIASEILKLIRRTGSCRSHKGAK